MRRPQRLNQLFIQELVFDYNPQIVEQPECVGIFASLCEFSSIDHFAAKRNGNAVLPKTLARVAIDL